MQPTKISIKDKKNLLIEWNDKSKTVIPVRTLRYYCPCAECKKDREERSASYIPIYGDDQINLTNIEMIGNYAVKFSWEDGHNTGMYEYDYLVKLADN